MQRPRRYGSVLALATGMLVAAAVPAPVAAEVVFSAYSGTSRTLSSDLRLRQPSAGTDLTVHDMHWNADPFKPAPYYGLRVTRFDPPGCVPST